METRYWPFVRGIHRSPVNSPHKGPVPQSFDVFFGWVNNCVAGDLRRHHAHYDITVIAPLHQKAFWKRLNLDSRLYKIKLRCLNQMYSLWYNVLKPMHHNKTSITCLLICCMILLMYIRIGYDVKMFLFIFSVTQWTTGVNCSLYSQ